MHVNIVKAFQLMLDKISIWFEHLVIMFPNAVGAIMVLLLFVLISRLAQRLVRGTLNRMNNFHNLPVITFFSNLTTTIVIMAGIFIALGILNLDKTVTSLLAGVGVIGLALSFAFQDIAANFMSGVFIIFRRPFKEGDILETNGKIGVVQAITVHTTFLHSADGQEILIPNKEVFKGLIVNYSQLGHRRVVILLNIKPAPDFEAVLTLLKDTAAQLPFILPEKGVEVVCIEIGGTVFKVEVSFWIKFPPSERASRTKSSAEIQGENFAEARSKAMIAFKKALDSNNIALN